MSYRCCLSQQQSAFSSWFLFTLISGTCQLLSELQPLSRRVWPFIVTTHVLYQQGRNLLSWLSWIALTSSPSLHLAGFCPEPPQSAFQHVLFAAHIKRMGRWRRKLLLWHLNRYRSEQTLGSFALRLGRNLAFTFWLSALWFMITSANSLVLENLLFSASPWWKLQACCQHKAFLPRRDRKKAVFRSSFLSVISCPALVPE